MVLELNSIFLHIRQLMVIEEVDRGSRAFRAIAVLNMATFIAFRIGTALTYMTSASWGLSYPLLLLRT